MRFLIKLFIGVSTLSILIACGSTKTTLRPEATANINKIAVIKVAEPEAYVAQDFGSIGTMFGAVGAAAAGGSSANTAKSVAEVAAQAKYKAGKRFTSQLAKRLASSGYQVSLITVSRKENHKLLKNYEAVNAPDADAILDVAIESIGYATEHPMFSPHWRPASKVHVALVDSRTGKTIYAEKFMYGYHNPFMSGTDIEAPEQFHFDSKDKLLADNVKLIEGLNHSVDSVVDQTVAVLKK